MKDKKFNPANKKDTATILSSIERGSKVEVMSLISNSPKSVELAAALSKLVKDRIPTLHTESGTKEIRSPDVGYLQKISEETSRNISENNTIQDLIPDMEACISLLVSSVLSPKDLMSTELNYLAPSDVLPPNVSAKVIEVIQNHFNQKYKFKTKLSKILREVLFTKGAYILAVMPENAVDELINRDSGISIESLNKNISKFKLTEKSIGILGPGINNTEVPQSNISLESLINNARNKNILKETQKVHYKDKDGRFYAIESLEVTDNINVLRTPILLDKIRRDSIKEIYNVSNESNQSAGNYTSRVVDKKLSALIYKSVRNKQNLIEVSKSQNQLTRNSVTGPLILNLPVESVIPVFPPGQPDHHVGYFVLLQNGYPVSSDDNRDSYRELQNQYKNHKNQNSHLIQRLDHLMNGIACPGFDNGQILVNTYADLIEQDLLARLRNGKYNNDYALGRNEDVYRVMLSRVLSQRNTQILFLPIEQVTYFATRYNNKGIGVSIMDEVKLVNTQRAIVSLANTMSSVRNSIGRTLVDITLDEDDPDPRKRAEEFRSEIIRTSHLGLPLAADSVGDMVTSLQASQYEFKFTGHPGMPAMNVEFDQRQSSYPQVDTDYEEQLRKRSISATGLSVEQVDDNFSGESATSVVSSSIMLSRKVMVIQDEIVPHITDHIKKVIQATPDLTDEIRAIIEENYDELEIDEEQIKELFEGNVSVKKIVINQIIKDYTNGLEVSLPRPTTVSLENQLATLEAYISLIDATIESWINDEMLGQEFTGEISAVTRSMINSVRSYFIRKFCADNAIMPELSKIITSSDSNDFNIYDSQTTHIESLIKSFSKFLDKLTPKVKESNAVYKKNQDALGDDAMSDSSDYGSDSSSDSTDSDDGFGGDDLGGDDLGGDMGDDMGGDMGEDPDGESEEDKGDDSDLTFNS